MTHTIASPANKKPAWSVFPELEPVHNSKPDASSRRRARPATARKEEKAAASDGHIKATTLSFSNMSHFGDLFVSFLKARKDTFIDRLHWNLPESEGMEFDQYDTPLSRWIAIHEFGEVLAGIRLTPTTARCGVYSYMLRDAQKGMLENIPSDVLFLDAPVEQRVWEASRLFIADNVPAHRRLIIQSVLMNQLTKAAREMGATHVIGIVPAVWSRWLRRLDLDAVAVGPKFTIDHTVSQAALFNVVKYVN